MYKGELQVNNPHPELLTFHHLKPRTDGYKFSTLVHFPKMFSELSDDLSNSVVIAGYESFRSQLKGSLMPP
jgi:hypothetical protein